MSKILRTLGVFSVLIAMTGCSQVKNMKTAMGKFIHEEEVKTAGLFSSDETVSKELSWSEDAAEADPSSVIYFTYDNSSLTPEAKAQLNKIADELKSDRSRVLQLAGHTDERGSREYNLALGWRRARAVQSYLTELGVRFDQLSAMSYGKEKPVDLHHDASAWAHNRRVVVMDLQQHEKS
jgi:peptidoglycan-associated lipoprotein